MSFHVNGRYGDDGANKDYNFKAALAASGACTPDQNITWNLTHREEWGLAFAAGATGFEQDLSIIHDTIAGDSWSATLKTPWGTFTTGGVGTITSLSGVVQCVNSAGLQVAADCSASLAFDSATWIIDYGAGPVSVLAAAIGAQAYAITGFDLRLCRHSCVPGFTTVFSSPHDLETCAGSPAAQPVWDKEPSASCVSGWEWRLHAGPGAWTEDPVEFQPDQTLPAVSCACPTTLPTGAGGTLSYHLTGIASLVDKITLYDYGAGGTVTLVCPLGGSVTGYLWSVRREFDLANDYVIGAIPKTFPTSPITLTETALCGLIGSPTSQSVDIATPGQSLLSKSRGKADGTKICWVHTSGTCTPVPPPLSNVPPFPSDTPWCGFSCTRLDSWPVAPPCVPGDKCLTYDVTFSHRHHVGWLRSGNFWTAYSDNVGADWTETDSGIAADWCCLRCDRQTKASPLFAWLEIGGAIVRYESTDEGKTWGMSTTISSGGTNKKPADVIGRHGWQYQYWLKDDGTGHYDVKVQIRDRADNIVAAEQVASGVPQVDNEGIAADEYVVGGGRHKIRLWVIVGGAKVAYTSVDGINFT